MSSDRSSNCVCACDPRQYVRSVRITIPASTRPSVTTAVIAEQQVIPYAQLCDHVAVARGVRLRRRKSFPLAAGQAGMCSRAYSLHERSCLCVRMKVGYARRDAACLRGRTHADTLHRSNFGQCQMHECRTGPMMRPAVPRTVTLRLQTCILERCSRAPAGRSSTRPCINDSLCAVRGCLSTVGWACMGINQNSGPDRVREPGLLWCRRYARRISAIRTLVQL